MVACEEKRILSDRKESLLLPCKERNKSVVPFVDELGTSTGPWPRYLVMTSTDGGKTLSKLSLFAISLVVTFI